MIVTESDGDSKSFQPTEESTSLVNAASSSGLPPYYQRNPATPPPMSTSTDPLIHHKSTPREPTWKRFSKAFLAAVAVYVLLGILIKSFVMLTVRHFVDGVPSGPLKGDGRVLTCANQTWSVESSEFPFSNIPPYTSTSSFHLPVSSSHIFLFSRGSYGHGIIKTELSDISGDTIEIEVITRYYSLEARNSANVCHLEREKDGQGIGVFTPLKIFPGYSSQDHITFEITIRFPRSGSLDHPLVINSLETNMGIWTHNIFSLENRVVFRSISLACSNAHIRADSVSAEFFHLQTSNAPITGSYNVSDSLYLKTSNAAILATLRLENKDGHKATHVEMKTSNARIESPITLVSTHDSSAPLPAAFSVTAKTSNGPLTVTFPDAPSSPFSLLNLNAKTSNARAYTKLHPTYEGHISLKTSRFTPSLVQKSTPKDPSGKGRQQNLDIRKVVRGALDAGIWWGDDSNQDKGKGTVVMTTSNAQNVIEL